MNNSFKRFAFIRNLVFNNQVFECTSIGIWIAAGDFTVNAQGLTIVGNSLENNNGGKDQIQMQFGDGGSDNGMNAFGLVTDNNCGGLVAVGFGMIHFTGGAASANITGCETGYVFAADPISYSSRAFTNTDEMLQNRARLSF